MSKKQTIQRHHIKYKEKDGHDWVVTVFKGEHQILTKMQWYCRKKVSKGFITALRYFICTREPYAIDLEEKTNSEEKCAHDMTIYDNGKEIIWKCYKCGKEAETVEEANELML